MKFDKFLVLTAAVAPLAMVTVPAVVQAAEADAEVTDVVVVGRKPLAESEASALKAQRNSDSLVSVISADAIGNLPDQNIAFAVGRLPGVTVERDQGQARYVNLRGAPNYWTTVSFDGLSVVSPEGRASRFDNIPSAIASQVVVQKAIVPSMPGDTVAGNVEIRTRRAFDYKGQKIIGKLGLGYVELGEGEEKDSSLVYSNIFMGGKLGVVGQLSYYSRDMATENWETDPYLVPDAGSVIKRFAQETKNKHYRLTRENYSFSTRLDYKLAENHSLFFSTINTAFDDTEHRDQFIFQLNQGTTSGGVTYGSTAFYASQAATFNPTKDTVYGGRISARITYRNYYDRMSTNTVGGESKFDNGLDVSWRLNYTWTDNTTDVPLELRFQNGSSFSSRPTFVYDFTNGSSNIVELYRTTGTSSARTVGARVQNIEDFDMPMNQATRQEDRQITDAWTAKVDVDTQTRLFGHDTKVEFGYLYTDRIKEANIWNEARTVSSTARLTSISQDGPYLGKQRLGYTFRYSNIDAAYALYNSLAISTANTRSVADFWKVNETINAAYLMAT
ncbi:MAG: TonB-dependent receptor plug domain-containing protein, partial [Asticcacaulis sp.]